MDQERFNSLLTRVTKKGEESVTCAGEGLTDEQLHALLCALEVSPVAVKALTLSRNNITTAGAMNLEKYMRSAMIEEVYLANNLIEDSGAEAFVHFFTEENKPKVLDLEGNPCSPAVITRLTLLTKSDALSPSVREALQTMTATSLSFAGLQYTDLDRELFPFLMSEVHGVSAVDFSGTSPGDPGAFTIGQVLRGSQATSLSLHSCGLTNMGLRDFIDAIDLAHHPTLSALDLSGNTHITNEVAMTALLEIFKTNNAVKSINLENTSVTSDARNAITEQCELNSQPGALKAAVVALWSESPEAREVNLQWQPNMTQCLRFLWSGIKSSTIIEKLNVSNSGIDDDAVALLAEALKWNTSLHVIELANNQITAGGVAVLFGVLQRGLCGVSEVNLANNDLGDDAAPAIIAAARANPKLTVVNIDINPKMSISSIKEIGGLVLINRAPVPVRLILPKLEQNSKEVTEVVFSKPTGDVYISDESVRLLCMALSSNKHVRKVDISNNSVTDTGAAFLAQLLSVNNSITELHVSNNAIGNRGAQNLCAALCTNVGLTTLDLSRNAFGEDGVKGFLEMLKRNHHLRCIQLAKTRVSDSTADAITHACALNRVPPEVKLIVYRLQGEDATLGEVTLKRSACTWALDDECVATLCKDLLGKSFVRSVDLSGNKITVEGCKHIAAVLADPRCNIGILNLSHNPINDYAFAALAQVFAENTTLTDLVLVGTDVTAVGAEVAAEALKQNGTITSLVLGEDVQGPALDALNEQLLINAQPAALKRVIQQIEAGEAIKEIDLHHQQDTVFGNTACLLLCRRLQGNQTVTSLDLSENALTSAAVGPLTEVIATCPSLSHVDISRNLIDDAGGDQLVACIESVRSVRSVNVHQNPISAATEERIGQLLSLNTGSAELKAVLLQHTRGQLLAATLDFNGNSTGYCLTDDELILLSQVLADATTVRSLDLRCNSFADAGCEALARVLRANHTLEELYLDNNGIGQEGGAALFHALKVNPQLQVLSLTNTAIPPTVLEDIESLLHVNQAPFRKRVDMRQTTVDELNDSVQFRSTDYYAAQSENVGADAIHNYQGKNQLLLE